MTTSYVKYVGNGSASTYSVPFPYLDPTHVKVRVGNQSLDLGAHYDFTASNAITIRPQFIPPTGSPVLIRRETPENPLVSYQDGAVLTSTDLNTATLQALYLAQELKDFYESALGGGLNGLTGNLGGNAQALIDNAVEDILNSALLADLQTRISDINANAESIILQGTQIYANANAIMEQAADITDLYTLSGAQQNALDLQALRFIPIEQNVATIQTQVGVLNTAQGNTATQITTLTSNFNGLSSAIQNEVTARTTADSALAQQISTLQAFTNRIFVQPNPPTADSVGDIWYDSDDGNHPYRWNGTAWVSIRDQNFAVLAAQITAEQTARVTADDALASSITQIQAQRNLDYALIVSNNTARINGDTALATSLSGLETRVGTAEAAIVTEQTARSTADTALTNQINQLVANVNANTAAITNEATARANADSATATQVNALSAVAGAKNRTYRASTAPSGTSHTVGDLWFDTSDNNKAYRWNGTSWELTTDTRIAANAAAIVTEQNVRANADTALASSLTALTTRVTNAESAIVTEQNTRASADSAESSARQALAARVTTAEGNITSNAAAIANEATARANADSANASQISAVSAVANAKNKSYRQDSAPASGMVEGDLWFDSDDGNKAYRWNGSSWVETSDTRIAANAAAIITEQNARATAISAEASARQALAARVTTTENNITSNTAAINNEVAVRAAADSSLASSISTLTSTVNGNTASIQTQQSVLNGLTAQYMVKLDVNGRIAGFGLYNNGATSDFIVLANKFAVVDPSNNANVKVPFSVVNGVVYMQNVVIGDAVIGNMSVGKLTNGTLNANVQMGTGKIIFDNGSYLMAQGVGFGSSSQFLIWYGPRPTGGNLSLCTEANARFYLKTNGDSYFGGTLSAGILKNSATTTSILSNASVIVGPFGSNGGPKTVVMSYNYRRARTISDAVSYGGSATATVLLQRSFDGSSWTTLATLNVTGSIEAANDGYGVYEPGQLVEVMGGSLTFTDTNTATANYHYRGILTSRTNYAFYSTSIGQDQVVQSIGVISTE